MVTIVGSLPGYILSDLVRDFRRHPNTRLLRLIAADVKFIDFYAVSLHSVFDSAAAALTPSSPLVHKEDDESTQMSH